MPIHALKRLRWDLQDPNGRCAWVCALLGWIPGNFGKLLRRRFLVPRFGAAGRDVDVHEGVRLRGASGLRVGDRVHIGVDDFIQASGGVTLGDDVILGPSVKIWSINHRFDDPDRPVASQGYRSAPVTIGDDCWLGANVFVMPGVELPAGCVVVACSVVGRKRYPPGCILSGAPARVIGWRRPLARPVPASDAAGGEEAEDAGRDGADRR